MQHNDNENAPRDLFTVAQFSERRPAWTEQALRALILNAADRQNSRGERIPGNGLAEAGAILRIGRRVYIAENGFFKWIAELQKQRSAVGKSKRTQGAGSECLAA